jgi:hypothetical protein
MPGCGRNLWDLVIGHVRQAGENFAKILVRIETTPTAAFDEGVDDGATLSRRRLADEQPVLLADGRGSKQFFHYDVQEWLAGDPTQPPPERTHGRNQNWQHVSNAEVISMPDKWEYPWFAACGFFTDIAFFRVLPSQVAGRCWQRY